MQPTNVPLFSLDTYPEVESLDHMVVVFLIFEVFSVAASIPVPSTEH